MATLSFYDAAYPPHPAPAGFDGVAGYIGGDTPYIWTRADWDSQPARWRLPIFVRSSAAGDAAADVAAALAQMKTIGASAGCLVAWDTETATGPAYIRAVYDAMKAAGHPIIVYGSEAYVLGNDNPDGLYWGADWNGVDALVSPDDMTQYSSGTIFDYDIASTDLPFWDTHPPKPVPATKWGPPGNLHVVNAGYTSVRLAWNPPGTAGLPDPSQYGVWIYRDGNLVNTYPRTVTTTSFDGGGLAENVQYDVHVQGVRPDEYYHPGVFASVMFTTGNP